MSADLLRRLIEAGTPAELVAEVAMLAGEAAALEKRRAADRERQRNYRNSDVTLHNVTSRDSEDVTDRVSPDKKTPQTPKELTLSRVCETRARHWHRLPEDWLPRALPIPVQSKVDLWPPGALADELAAFRRWAANAEDKNGKGRKLDWDQAWRNWIGRRHDERYAKQYHPSQLGKTAATYAMLNAGPDEPF